MLALALVLVTASPDLEELPFRLYVSQAAPVVANLAAHPAVRRGPFAHLTIQLMLKHPAADIEAARAVMAEAAKIGVPIIPGFRCMETPAPGGDADADRWKRNADYLSSIVREFPGTT